MISYYRLNKDYISSFQTKVFSRYNGDDKRTETGLFRAILKEINELFNKIGGQISNKRNLPKPDEYPSSEKHNKLVEDIAFDIDKLYNAQKLIDIDIGNLSNFNSSQRDKTFENMEAIQQQVYSAYVRSKKDLIGGTEFPAGNPFTSADGMDPDSEDVFIDEDSKLLTLASDPKHKRTANSTRVAVYFVESLPERVYPIHEIRTAEKSKGGALGVGHHWKIPKQEAHFINQDNSTDVEAYKTMMVDDPTTNTSVGFCEFESVRTVGKKTQKSEENVHGSLIFFNWRPEYEDPAVSKVKDDYNFVRAAQKYIGECLGLDSDRIKIDGYNSFQGQYITDVVQSTATPKFKLLVPLDGDVITNEVIVEFTANEAGFLPKVIFEESKMMSSLGDHPLMMKPADAFDDGRVVCQIAQFARPNYLELILQYDSLDVTWSKFSFMMTHYKYSDMKKSTYLTTTAGDLTLNLRREYNIFVDSEANKEKEKARAYNILAHPNKES